MKLHKGSLINHQKKLAWIFLPKCGGNSIWDYLKASPTGWIDPVTVHVDTHIEVPDDYQVFCVGRNPRDWIESGYRWSKQRHDYKLDFKSHVKAMLYSNFEDREIWWHCVITPDIHVSHYPDIKIFQLEKIQELQKWLATFFPDLDEHEFPHRNKTDVDHTIIWDEQTVKYANAKMYRYNKMFNYKDIA